MWRSVKYGMKRLWDRRKRWLRERVDSMISHSDTERIALHPCVAHRGWSGKAPENTMAAFRLAMSEPAVQWMEFDVHLSRDEVPVVIHDPTLKRTTNGRGRVSEWTAAELSRLDAGSWFDPAFAKEGVPTLDEVLALAAGRCRLNIEIKGEDSAPPLIARKVIELIQARRLEYDVVITSFRPEVLLAVRELTTVIRTGLIIDDQPPDLIPNVRSLGASFLSIGFRHLTGPLLQEAEDAGVTVMAWTVNQPADLQRIVSRPEPIMVCTNYPDRWLAAITRQEDR
ncbi:glycerophosphodiester phosphodiesterase [Cohnella caldifontis]|uniref:glycerophosphodiester phosphodiesterase n=1 Tax=Cohnella caldifontis TaxID=3027471 RepID=UPI0023EC569F|nr:glycerophosphodiester phosphodiesterase family protein [Cohnella sp. YIM B05605]